MPSEISIKRINEEGKEIVLYEPETDPRCDQLAFHTSNSPNLLALGTRGTGKAVAPDTPVPTPSGYVAMRDLTVGSHVFDEHGIPTRVVWKSETHVDEAGTYRLTFDDGSTIVCGGHHEWLTLDKAEATRKNPGGSVKTTAHIASTVKVCHGRETNHRLPLGGAWQQPDQVLPIDPYVLGAWLGDGSRGGGEITSADPDIIVQIESAGYSIKKQKAEYLWAIEGLGPQLRQLDAEERTKATHGICPGCDKQRAFAARGVCDRCYHTPGVREQHAKAHKGFKRYRDGVLKRKRIPEIYFRGSAGQRLALLQGLMDTDGSCDKRQGSCEFCNTNVDLAVGVYELVVSLGLKPVMASGRAILNGRDCGTKYRVTWTATLPVFRLQRKLDRLPTKCRGTQAHRYIVAAERIADQPLQCIQVANASHQYLVGYAAIPTHNSTVLRWDAIMRCLTFPGFRALILRRKMPELQTSHLHFIEEEMIKLGGEKNGFRYLSTIKEAIFPNGSVLKFSHCEKMADVMNYLSSEWGFIGFDELSTFPLEMFLPITAAARARADAPYKAVVRAGSNTLGIGSAWMRQWFGDPLHGVPKSVDHAEYPDYYPDDWEVQYSWMDGNSHINQTEYVKRLKSMPEHVRKSWLELEFITEGAYFSEFRKNNLDDKGGKTPWHCIQTLPTWQHAGQRAYLLDIPWIKVTRSVDWGYHPDPAVCHWHIVLPSGRKITFKEMTWKRTLAKDVALEIKRASANMHVSQTDCDPTMFVKDGMSPFSIADIFEQNGVPLTPAQNDRELYGYAVHELLATEIEENGRTYPSWQILEPACPELVRTLPILQMDATNPKKIADGPDHWVISCAYFGMSQAPPSKDPVVSAIPRWLQPKRRR